MSQTGREEKIVSRIRKGKEDANTIKTEEKKARCMRVPMRSTSSWVEVSAQVEKNRY